MYWHGVVQEVWDLKGVKNLRHLLLNKRLLMRWKKAMAYGLKEVGIKVQGPGSGRETAVKSVGSVEGIRVAWLKDITPLPHNGCRPPKRRRV